MRPRQSLWFSAPPRILTCLGGVHNSITIKRLSLKRRPRVAVNNVEKPQSNSSPSQWTSSESLSSQVIGDDARVLARGRPPLPPPYSSSADSARNEGCTASQKLLRLVSQTESKPLPAARSLALPRHNPPVENTLTETNSHVEQDRTNQPVPEPHPRRRLASFGGVGSTGSLSPFTGLGAFNQTNNGNKLTDARDDFVVQLTSSLGNKGSTCFLSSGRSTPVTSLSPMHLQNVRDQMVIALQRLKEMEEQVKVIPILQVRISVLQEEKRKLISQLTKQKGNQDLIDVFRKRAYSAGCSDLFLKDSDVENETSTEEGYENIVQSDCTGLKEFRKLTEEMQALERTIKGGCPQPHGLSYNTPHIKSTNSVAVGTDEDQHILMPAKQNKHDVVDTKLIATCSIATEVSEVDLGIVTEWEAALEAQHAIIESLNEKNCLLEAELKDSALQKEMSCLKLELQAAEARNQVDKSTSTIVSTESKSIEAKPETRSQGVGYHIESQDASTGERMEMRFCTVGISCKPELRSVSTCPDVPMSEWHVRKQVESREQCVGTHIFTNTQGVGTEMSVCDAGTNTDLTTESGIPEMEYLSMPCGDCSVYVTETKEKLSDSMARDLMRAVDFSMMASTQTASKCTNTTPNSVTRFTNTKHAFNTNSSTNTILNTQEKHTNTTQTVTRTGSVSNRATDLRGAPETRSLGIGTVAWAADASALTPVDKPKTRDMGVGFTNINENFLVGLKTRNMACGPSHLPDPTRTRSIGVGEGKIRNFSATSQTPGQFPKQTSQSQLEPELKYYVETMQRLLKEQQDLDTESNSELQGAVDQQYNSPGSANAQMSGANTAMCQGETEVHAQESKCQANRQFHSLFWPQNDSTKSDTAKSEIYQLSCNDSGVKKKIELMEQHAASALQDRSAGANILRSIIKKQNDDRSCRTNRKYLKSMGVATGLNPMSTHCGDPKLREVSGVSFNIHSAHSRGYATPGNRKRFRLGERMLSACQALRTYLSDDKSLPSREVHICLHTVRQEWFSVSSQKSASPSMVQDYLWALRSVSPSVLHHVANMADGNGNTALHYSVSHSNFAVVQKMLDAGVCNVNHQNKAGYTPIMLAALAAVDAPQDMKVVEELFANGDVNAKASQAGQTALMLAVSHGRVDMVHALLAQGSEINLQDDEGSTALMCASEHGHVDIVKLLLEQPECNAGLSDGDESTALSIALEAGHNDIALLLYAHANFSKGQAPPRLGGKTPHLLN